MRINKIFTKHYSWHWCRIIVFISLYALTQISCEKYLDEKPIKLEKIPATLDDLKALLDNQQANTNSPGGLLELVADNFYITTANWQSQMSATSSLSQSQALHYIWDKNAIPYSNSWVQPYQGPIFTANLVLDHLPLLSINEDERDKYNKIKGAALFYRAFSFHQLAQLYCKPYSSSSSTDLGIVLKLTSNINEQSVRSTVQQTYDRIISDLKEAATLLSETSTFPTQPNKVAAYAALARVYLSMREYTNAGDYANRALLLYNTIIDYNTLMPIQVPPVKTFNQEVIYHNSPASPSILLNNVAKIDSNLYQSYRTGDLRKMVFFNANSGTNSGTYSFRGSYNGNQRFDRIFDGLATNELYLIRAECFARNGNKEAALSDLNALLEKRWKNDGTWISINTATIQEALQIILMERRKELIFRGQRWSDLRRFNLEGENISLHRNIGGTNYNLPPNDHRWVMLIPWEVINRSNVIQNPR